MLPIVVWHGAAMEICRGDAAYNMTAVTTNCSTERYFARSHMPAPCSRLGALNLLTPQHGDRCAALH
jgi:hypothetical protein